MPMGQKFAAGTSFRSQDLIAAHACKPFYFLFGAFSCSIAPQAFFRPDRKCPTPVALA
jgi:hypothetical protein